MQSKQKRDIYQDVTDQIVSAMEDDPGSWLKPWVNAGGVPFNATTGKTYRGVNILLLWGAARRMGYTSNGWASFKQWKKAGASVRGGERGNMIVFYKKLTRKGANGEDGPGEESDRAFYMLRYSAVFNADQVDGYDAPAIEMPDLADRLDAAEDYVINTGANIVGGNGRAYYSPAHDHIGMPAREAFTATPTSSATECYYSTLCHELTHWTGHASRCGRDLRNRFGDQAYAAEELIAELGAAFQCATLNISSEPRADHAQYLANWLRVLKGDNKAILTAAARASDAVEYIDSLQYDGDNGKGNGARAPSTPKAANGKANGKGDGAQAPSIPIANLSPWSKDGWAIRPATVADGPTIPASPDAFGPAKVKGKKPKFGTWYTSWLGLRTRVQNSVQNIHGYFHDHPLPSVNGIDGPGRVHIRAAQWAAWRLRDQGINLDGATSCNVEALDDEDAAYRVTFGDKRGVVAQCYVPRWPDCDVVELTKGSKAA